PAVAVRVGEVAGVAAPLTSHGLAQRMGSELASPAEDAVDLLRGGDVVGQRHGRRAVAASDRADLLLEGALVPQAQHEMLADLDHEHLTGGIELGVPPQTTEVEGATGRQV